MSKMVGFTGIIITPNIYGDLSLITGNLKSRIIMNLLNLKKNGSITSVRKRETFFYYLGLVKS